MSIESVDSASFPPLPHEQSPDAATTRMKRSLTSGSGVHPEDEVNDSPNGSLGETISKRRAKRIRRKLEKNLQKKEGLPVDPHFE